jgi:hypothetical protein
MIDAPFYFVSFVSLCFNSSNPLPGSSGFLKHRGTEDTELWSRITRLPVTRLVLTG